MRTPERLFAVIDSLNFNVLGHSSMAIKIAAIQFRRDGVVAPQIIDEVEIEAFAHPSPHVRELASDLLELMVLGK